ncbi:MAG: extracellular solute-binding protein [Lachnospiraceae bacterium]|nr:extracellular solute-binding protein [Lachnospiraceae bacterium]
MKSKSLKRVLAVAMAATMTVGIVGCGNKTTEEAAADKAAESSDAEESADAEGTEESAAATDLSYADFEVGVDGVDLETTISFFNNRTDLDSDEYGGVNWKEYIAEFNKMYPGITVEVLTDTNYADSSLTHLQSGDYETVMMIPDAIDRADLSNYFISYGDYDTMSAEINYANRWLYEDQVYGVPSTATTRGIVYNKKVFEAAGITTLPATPADFMAALQAIKDNTDAIPLYTNYAAGWTMSAWDDYIGVTATGDIQYMNQKLVHTQDPFKNYGDDTHAYAVYKILYDAVAGGLTEEDYTTTDWEGCKSMINNGEIGCIVLGSWAYPQMEAGGPNAADIGYMPFPITVGGRQYATSGADYCYGINVNASDEEKLAGMAFVKWMTEQSGFTYNECGLPVVAGSSETKLAFDGVILQADEAALEGEEDFLNAVNSESELMVTAGGDTKIQKIIEHAANGDKSFDDIMAEWNQAWTDAQEVNGIEVTE